MEKKYCNWLFIFIISALFWGINQALPYLMDDELYAHIYPEVPIDNGNPHCLDINKPINSFGEVIVSQWHHYFTKNGRGLVHIIVQTFCGLTGKRLFNLLTAVVFGLFAMLYAKTTSRNNSGFQLSFAALSLFVFFCLIPEPTCLYDGIAYGINYLWSSTACLACLWIITSETKTNGYKLLLSIILCFAAGWSHEGLVIGLGAGLLCYTVKHWSNLTYDKWLVLGAFAIGASLLVFSPANFSRAEGMNDSSWAGGPIMLRIRAFSFMRATHVLLILCIALFIVCRKKLIEFVKDNDIILIAFATSILFIVAVGALNYRSVYGIDFYATILICKILPCFSIFDKIGERVGVLACGCLIAGLSCCLYYNIQTGKQYDDIDNAISNCKGLDCVAKVEDVNPPYFIKRFICQYKFDEPWEDWEERVATWKYSKRKVIIAEGECKKVTGDNPFYKLGNYLYSEEPLTEEVSMEWKLGKYQAFDATSILKKIAAKIMGKETEATLSLSMSTQKMKFAGKHYWVIGMSPYQSREILEMNIKKE